MNLKKLLTSLEKHVTVDFFNWLDYSFKLEGVMPPKEGFKRIIYLILAIPHCFAITILATILDWINFYVSNNGDVKMKMLSLTMVLFYTITSFRILMYIITSSRVEKIKSIIRRPTFNFECFKIVAIDYEEALKISRTENISFGSVWKKVNPSFTQYSEIETYRVQTMYYTRLLCTAIYLSLVVVCGLTAFTWNYNESNTELYEAFNLYLNKTSLYRKFQLKYYLPFDTSLDGHYWLGFLSAGYIRSINLMTFLPIENVLTSSIIHLIGQTMIVQEAFKYVDKNICQSQNSRNVFLIKHIRIVKCINELQYIYRAIEMLEEICSFQMMIQYGVATFMLCTLTYVFPMVNSLTETFCCVIFLSASIGEIFMFSYVCQSLTLVLQDVAKSVYGVEWPFYPLKMKKNIVFTLNRLQKPACFTAGKLFTINLVFFIQVLQRAYSFYTLISNTRKN